MEKISTFSFICCILSLMACNRHEKTTDLNVVKAKYVHKYGLEVDEQDWQMRGKNGRIIESLDNGVVVNKQYTRGVLDGEVFYTFPHSNKVEKTEIYEQGTLVKTINNNEAGIPDHEILHSPDGEKVLTSWYETGNPRCREVYKNNQLHHGDYYSPSNALEYKVEEGNGFKSCRASNGDLLAHEEYRDGCIKERTEYHSNKAVKSKACYSDPLNCEKRSYLPDGEPKTIEKIVDGKQHGVTIVFKNGEKYAEVPYYKGLKHGIEKRYRDGHILIEEIHWVNDKMQGPYYTYVDGQVTKTIWYYQGKMVSKPEYDFKTAKRTAKRSIE